MFCSGVWLTGGMERKMANLFRELKKYYDIYLLTVDGGSSVIEVPREVNRIVLSKNVFNEKYSNVALKHAKKHSIDIVIGVMNLFHGQLDLYEKCNQNHIKTIAANSEYYFYPYYNKHYYNIVNRRQEVFTLVDAVLWHTNFSAAVYGHINANGYVMPNPNTFSKQTQLAKKDNKIIICVGRFNDYIKRIDRILTCFKKILEKEPDARLWLVGPCDLTSKIERIGNKSIQDMMDEQELNDSQVLFVGEVLSIEDYYLQASVLLLTSESEGFGNVISEAASFGLPVVYNEIPGLEDIIVEGYNGLISKQNDIDALADNVCKILSDNKLREKLGQQASSHIEQFNLNIIINKWKKVIDAVASSSDAAETKIILGNELNYTIKNYNKFCNVLTRELNNAFGAANENINMINKQLVEKDNKLKDITAQLNYTYNELERIKKQLYDVIRSKSWKVTKPLRKTSEAISIGKKKLLRRLINS